MAIVVQKFEQVLPFYQLDPAQQHAIIDIPIAQA